MDDVEKTVIERLEEMRNLLALKLQAMGKATRRGYEMSGVWLQRVRRQKSVLTVRTYELKSSWRRSWKKLMRRRPPAAIVPVFFSPDFMESLFQRSVEMKLHVLLQLRTAARLGCDTTSDARAEACSLHGWLPELIRSARNGATDLGLSERENLLLRYADDITRTPIDVDLQVFRQLRRHFTHDQIVEITTAICYENFRTRFRNALGMEASIASENVASGGALSTAQAQPDSEEFQTY